jgi:hypothetical protein
VGKSRSLHRRRSPEEEWGVWCNIPVISLSEYNGESTVLFDSYFRTGLLVTLPFAASLSCSDESVI